MKTTNNAQETVKGQLNTMVLRGSAVVAVIALISLSVSAQEFWKQLLTANASVQAYIQTAAEPSEFKKADAVIDAVRAELAEKSFNFPEAMTIESEKEKELEIEDWMTSRTLFGSNTAAFVDEKDEPLDLEGWMINGSNFGTQATFFADEAEPALRIEAWMTDETRFSNATEILTEREAELRLEDWMTDDVHFSNKGELENSHLHLEAWMADNNYWDF